MAAKVIINFIAKGLFKKKGAIANNKAVEFSANALEQRLKNFGIDPNAITSENELNQILSAVKQAEDAAFSQQFGNMLGGSKFDRAGEVFDMTGKKLDSSRGIMGGTQIDEKSLKEGLMKTDNPFSDLVKTTDQGPKTLKQREAEVLARMNRENKEAAQRIRDRKKLDDPEDMAQGGRAGYKFGIGPLFKFLNKKSPMKAYTDYLNSIKTRMKAGKEAEVAGEVIPVAATGALITNQVKKKLKAMNEEQKKEFKKDMEKRADGGRIGYADGTPDTKGILDMLDVQASGFKTGKQQIEGAPDGITIDSESINAIIKADIPISQKIDLIAEYKYGKNRDRVDDKGKEIFLGEGGYKDQDIGFGYNQGGEGISGSVMRDLRTGDDEFKIKLSKKFAEGGRIGLKDGPKDPRRRGFMKAAVGIASMLPFGIGKGVKMAAPVVTKAAEITGPALSKIVDTVMSLGKTISQSGRRLKELTTKKKHKGIEVEEDNLDGSYIIKKGDKEIYYKPGRMDETGGIEDDIIEVIENTVTKKAGGGIARMLGE